MSEFYQSPNLLTPPWEVPGNVNPLLREFPGMTSCPNFNNHQIPLIPEYASVNLTAYPRIWPIPKWGPGGVAPSEPKASAKDDGSDRYCVRRAPEPGTPAPHTANLRAALHTLVCGCLARLEAFRRL
ncbi:hypothetical protein J6590_051270 [Homalodisca vitripennis]|nr:hypothetical protein J6590_051270 [Homalodisca vitripennis]